MKSKCEVGWRREAQGSHLVWGMGPVEMGLQAWGKGTGNLMEDGGKEAERPSIGSVHWFGAHIQVGSGPRVR